MSAESIAVALKLGHPERVRILQACAVEPQSPVMLAPTNADIGRVSYHFRVLEGRGLIELVDLRRRRGSVQHMFAATDEGKAMAEALGT